MSGALFLTVLTASLLGSAHCAGMCGPLVAVYASDPLIKATQLRAHGAYHGGRLLTYATLGAAAGALGGLVDHAGTLVGIATLAALVAGGLVALWGAVQLLSILGLRSRRLKSPAIVQRATASVLRRLRRYPPGMRAGVLGLSSGLLPCGFLYAFISVAAGTAHPLAGAGVMAAFWLGTVPALAVVGEGVRRLSGRFSARLPVLSAVALIVVGLGTVWFRADKVDAISGWLGSAEADPAAATPSCH